MGYEKWVSIRERNIKLLLETIIYIAITETVTCIITIETVMCKMHCRIYHLHNCNRDSHLHNYNKKFPPHICYRNCHLHETSKPVQFFLVTLFIVGFFIVVAYHTVANLARLGISVRCNSNRRCHLHNRYRKRQLHSSNRNYHLQNQLPAFTCIDIASQMFLYL